MPELKPVTIEEEKFFFSLSFDIDDFIGDGIWWLQIYNRNRKFVYDRPYASSISKIDEREVVEFIRQLFLTYGDALL